MKITNFISLLVVAVLLTGCIQTMPTAATSTEVPPAATATLSPTATQEPSPTTTEIPPTETNTPGADAGVPITAQNASLLTLSDSITLAENVHIQWALDQHSFFLVGSPGFWVYSYPDLELLFTYETQPDEMLVDVSPDGLTYVTTSNQNDLLVSNWQDGTSHPIETGISFMAGSISPDGTSILLAKQDEMAGEIFDLQSGTHVATLTGFQTAAPVYHVTYAADGAHALWIARATIQLSEIASNTIGEAFFHEDFLSSYALSPDGAILVTSAGATVNDAFTALIFFYDAVSGEESGYFEVPSPSFSLDFSPDSQLLAASVGFEVVILDAVARNEIHRVETDPVRVDQVAFSPNGDVLAICGDDQTVSFWVIGS